MSRRGLVQVRTRTLIAACVGLLLLAVATRAQQAPAATPPLPLAAGSLLLNPDLYMGETVALYAPVEEALSRTAFTVDQDANQASLDQVLIVVPTLTAQPEAGAYVTVIGEVMTFDPIELQSRAEENNLDLPPAVVERFRGKAVIFATSVFDPAMADLAKVPLAPLTPEEEAFAEIMKQVNPASAALRKGVADANVDEVRTQAKLLKDLFEDTQKFFEARDVDDAAGWAKEGVELADSIDKSADGNRWAEAREASTKLTPLCQSCHGAYRERVEDGTYRIKKSK